ncbi:MAG: prepilin-type N-terminal cleavage/methylation domain-containing protein [Oligoflexia bacterium]|nr:prepilin-type N-terminal cleavage/methylation domain-containing protein [Oligoflexia bacterium]
MRIKSTQAAGFTLLELLVVLTIVSIMSAIALPQYTAYRQRAFDLRALSDLRSVALAEEAYFLDFEKYLSCANQSCTVLPGIRVLSNGVTLAIQAGNTDFTGSATHPQGSGKTFQWDTAGGGLLNP